MRQAMKRGCLGLVLLVAVIAIGLAAFVFVQARRVSPGRPDYVALGSSFSAGPALGPLQPGSPLVCARTEGSYPQRLARQLRLSIVDMSCGGATTAHVLGGGQFFQGSQVRSLGAGTRLVTITVGGNDIGYVGDLSLLAARRSGGLFGWAVRHIWNGPAATRDYTALESTMLSLIRAVRQRAPQARIVVATYPAILPPQGTCARLRITEADAAPMRAVATQLTAATRRAAVRGGAILVDMGAIGAAHHACAGVPWTKGWTSLLDAPFHPTAPGAAATAQAIAAALRASPAAVAAVGQDDAAGHQARRVGR